VGQYKVNFQSLDRSGQSLRMRLSSTAVDVRHEGAPGKADHVSVTYIDNATGKPHRVRGAAVIMAGGQWMNKHVIRDAPNELASAMNDFNHAPMLVVNVGVRHWRYMERLGVTSARWSGSLGWFTNVRAPMSIAGEHMPLDPSKPAVLTFYNSFSSISPGITNQGVPLKAQCVAARQALFSLSYRAIETAMREQLSTAFADYGFDHEKDVAALVTNRWGHAYVAPQPGFYFGQNGGAAPRDVVRNGFGRVRFSHSELSGTQLWSAACQEGQRAAMQVLELLA
jgi:spermidine dehydrogenase